MLFAASVKVAYRKGQRRIDVVVEAEELEIAKEKAIKQARKIYLPSKKAVYTVTEIITEKDAYQTLANPKTSGIPAPGSSVPAESEPESVGTVSPLA